MITFKSIYNRAVNLFDDPDIQKAYVFNTVKFEKLMYPYLVNGIPFFSQPTAISFLLVDQTLPEGKMEIIDGNGDKTYKLSLEAPEEVDWDFSIGGKPDPLASYDKETNSVTFSKEVPEGTKCTAEWYSAGCFNSNFSSAASSSASAQVIENRVTDIMARALHLAWAEEQKDSILEIRNILTDTDFKIHAPAQTTQAKIAWTDQIHREFDTMTNNLGWLLQSRKQHGGKYYGN